MESLCQAVEGNFLNMPFPEAAFDGAYAIEATCHADKVCKVQSSDILLLAMHHVVYFKLCSQLQDAYAEVFRVLKPGAYFASYEWVSTKEYNPNNKNHVRIMDEINYGNGLPVRNLYAPALLTMAPLTIMH